MAKYIEDEVHIENHMDLEAEMCKYNCHTKEELEELLWYDYGVILILDYGQLCAVEVLIKEACKQ